MLSRIVARIVPRIAQRLRHAAARARLRRRPRADGFNLVVLAVMITVMNVMVAKALPKWSHVIERDQESELIFRGLQYAEAIRVFKQRFNRLPVRLKELIEVEPRAIRQLWNNPLSPDSVGKPPEGIGWGLIFQGQPVIPEGQQDPGDQPRDLARSPDRNESRSIFDEQPAEKVEVGPILGVYSKIDGEAIRVFCDNDTIQQWRFTSAMLELAVGTGAGNQGATPVAINSELIGRPLPPGVTPPRNLGVCGGSALRGNNLGNPGRGRGRNLVPDADTDAPNTDKLN